MLLYKISQIMQTKCISVFTIDELSEKAKDRAHSAWVEGNEYFWADDNRKTLYAFAELFPIKVTNYQYGGCNSGDGVTWHFTDCNYNGVDFYCEATGVRLLSWLENNIVPTIHQRKTYYKYSKTRKNPKNADMQLMLKRTSKVLYSDDGCPLTGYCVDNAILDPIYKFMKKPVKGITLDDLIGACFDSWVKACNEDVEYQNSMECFIEVCEANSYTFTEAGRMENI